MAKKTAKEFVRDLGIKQLFARCQTPEDNSWTESWFRIFKYDWLRFKDYVSFTQSERVIEDFRLSRSDLVMLHLTRDILVGPKLSLKRGDFK